MKELTETYSHELLAQYPTGDIRDTVVAIKTRLAAFDSEADAERKETLMEEVHDLKTVLKHEIYENGRGGEDFINDGVFHVQR